MTQVKLRQKVVDPSDGSTSYTVVRKNIDDRDPKSSVEYQAICDYLGVDEFKRYQSYVSSRVVKMYNFFADRMRDPTPEGVYERIRTFMKSNKIPALEGAELVRRVSHHVRLESLREEKARSIEEAESRAEEKKVSSGDIRKARELRRGGKRLGRESARSEKNVKETYEKDKEKFEKNVKEGKEFPKIQITAKYSSEV
jgi:hypothetical protein